jgi:hypothetical protein
VVRELGVLFLIFFCGGGNLCELAFCSSLKGGKVFFWLIVSEVSVHNWLTTVLKPVAAQYIMAWSTKLLTSLWLGSKERERKGLGSQYPL